MSLISLGMICGVTTAGKVLGSFSTSKTIISPHAILYAMSSIVTLISATIVAIGLPETLTKNKRKPFLEDGSNNGESSLLNKIKQSPASAAKLLTGRGRQIRWLSILLILQSLPSSMGDIFQGK